jgi:hypothetical protein
MSKKRILQIDSSNDMLEWKSKYNRNPRSFKIIGFNKNEITDPKSPNLDVDIHQDDSVVTVELSNYLPSKNKNISEEVKNKIKVFSDWIDYWAIDYDKKDLAFINMWISFRTPKKRKLKLRSDPYHYKKPGVYNLTVKAFDIFGTVLIKSYKIKV